MLVNGQPYRTVWMEGSVVRMINQPLLPHLFKIIDLEDTEATAHSISDMIVRGAPAIGATGAYGVAQATLLADSDNWLDDVKSAAARLSTTRPTAQDLFYGIKEIMKVVESAGTLEEARKAAVERAKQFADDSAAACERIGTIGADLIEDNMRILTHCNAGWLATVDWGTATAPIYKAKRQGKDIFVFVDETRPRCQGARLTAWEMAEEKIPHAIIVDNAAGYFMASSQVDMVITGTDRVARNGDVANKIGTYEKAVLAQRHGIPFYVAAPASTIDFDCPTGADIPIEERDESEVLNMFGMGKNGEMTSIRISPQASSAKNPAFDVTPASLVTGLITEKGLIRPENLAQNQHILHPRK
ncbi:MAG: S-methyl-5-thioribose-1-phosphate isomerase [Candidatus Sumerlaeota bacterium]